jgi:hypothetical protein
MASGVEETGGPPWSVTTDEYAPGTVERLLRSLPDWNGQPLARMIPIRRRRAVPKEEVLAMFATAPAIDAEELRADLDDFADQEARDPFEGTGL